jgi:hypothetical protein
MPWLALTADDVMEAAACMYRFMQEQCLPPVLAVGAALHVCCLLSV